MKHRVLDINPVSAKVSIVMRWFFLLLSSFLLASCAYVQTHKNVEQWGNSYTGYRLLQPLQLYQQGNDWYLAGEQVRLKKDFPIVHDTIFRVRNNDPVFKPIPSTTQHCISYHRISAGTAHVLQRKDGYAQLDILSKEIEEDLSPWLSSLASARQVPVLAECEGQNAIAVERESKPAQIPWGNQILSKADFVLVDVPGTILYNVSIPFAAPFVFFHEFLSEE